MEVEIMTYVSDAALEPVIATQEVKTAFAVGELYTRLMEMNGRCAKWLGPENCMEIWGAMAAMLRLAQQFPYLESTFKRMHELYTLLNTIAYFRTEDINLPRLKEAMIEWRRFAEGDVVAPPGIGAYDEMVPGEQIYHYLWRKGGYGEMIFKKTDEAATSIRKLMRRNG